MDTKSIINPDSEITLSSGNKVTVKLLRWKKALEFFDKLKASVKGLINEKGGFSLETSKVMDAVQGNAELLEWLALETTGKDTAWLEQLDIADMAKVSVKALEINLSAVAEQIKNARSRLAALAAGAQTDKSNQTSPQPAT